MANQKNNNHSLERQLFQMADKLRKNIDAAEYKHVVLGLIFLRYISNSFKELQDKLVAGGRYVGIKDEVDDGIPFKKKISGLTKKLAEQMAEEKKLDQEIKKQLQSIGFKI